MASPTPPLILPKHVKTQPVKTWPPSLLLRKPPLLEPHTSNPNIFLPRYQCPINYQHSNMIEMRMILGNPPKNFMFSSPSLSHPAHKFFSLIESSLSSFKPFWLKTHKASQSQTIPLSPSHPKQWFPFSTLQLFLVPPL